MRCSACNVVLSDFEATRKVVREDSTVSYPDLCNRCFRDSGLSSVAVIVERHDLVHEEDVEEENVEYYTERTEYLEER